ncbi:MAG: glycosyltransferase [Bdellovibrionales bacterium]|nr:glycosyltransferase [Bdellovibrionales bacterium]
MAIACFGTYDVANYGDLIFPELIKFELGSALKDEQFVFVSPVGGPSIVSDSVPTITFDEALQMRKDISGVIVGGGNIIDCAPALNPVYSESIESSLLAYPSLWIGASMLAQVSGAPLCWNAPGVPGKLPEIDIEQLRTAIASVDYLSVRDTTSAKIVSEFEASANPCVVPDTAVALSRVWTKESLLPVWEDRIQTVAKLIPKSARTAVFHLKSRYLGPDASLEELCSLIGSFCSRNNLFPIFLAIGPIHKDDFVVRKVSKLYKDPHLAISELPSLKETTAILAHADFYFGSSLHGAIVHYAYGRTPVCVASPEIHKFADFFARIGHPELRIDNWTSLNHAAAVAETLDLRPALNRDLAELNLHWRKLAELLSMQKDTPKKRMSPARIKETLVSACSRLAPDFLIPQLSLHRRRAEEARLKQQIQGLPLTSGAPLQQVMQSNLSLREDLADLRQRQDKTLRQSEEIKNDLAIFGSRMKDLAQNLNDATSRFQRLDGFLSDAMFASDNIRAVLAQRSAVEQLERLDELAHLCRTDLVSLHTMINSRTFLAGRKIVALGRRLRGSANLIDGPWVPDRYDGLEAELRRCESTARAIRSQIADAGSLTGGIDPDSFLNASQEISQCASALHSLRAELLNCINSVQSSKSFKLGLSTVGSVGAIFQQPGAMKLRAAINDHPTALPSRLALSTFTVNPNWAAQGTVRPERDRLNDGTVEPQGTIAICVHNAFDDVRVCLESVLANTNLNIHRLVIIDDGSDFETADFLRRLSVDSRIMLIRNDQARGYTKAANQGIEASTGDFVVLLNSDVIVPWGWLERLTSCAFSRPGIGVVGPLSNAASWQSIPELRTPDGKWAVNTVPNGMTLEDFSHELAATSQRLYPQVSLVNGFCYLITRAAVDSVGKLDEAAFPMGYGEEDDFSLRAQKAGFVHLIADDCYVFHAKSKSFGTGRRTKLAQAGAEALNAKHPGGQVRDAVIKMQQNDSLTVARHYACQPNKREAETVTPTIKQDAPLSIGWVKPHLGQVGGVRRTIEMTNRLYAKGHKVTVFTPDGEKADWMPMWAECAAFDDIDDSSIDILIVSDPDVIEPFLRADAAVKIVYHLAAYMLYRDESNNLARYYQETKSFHHIANSKWTADHVYSHCGVRCDAVFEGAINRTMFAPRREKKIYDAACYGSSRPHKGTDTIEEAAEGLNLLKISEQSPSQIEISHLISSASVFVSACWHEGFSFCPLEAMACGVPVVMTDDGGSREYARNGENALVSEPKDADALRANIEKVLNDAELRSHLIRNGLETAGRFSWNSLVSRFDDYLCKLAQPNLQAASTKKADAAANDAARA